MKIFSLNLSKKIFLISFLLTSFNLLPSAWAASPVASCAISTFSGIALPVQTETPIPALNPPQMVIDSATMVPAGPTNVEFCSVKGHIHTANLHAVESDKEIQIEVRLPTSSNSKYMQYGGGFDGSISAATIPGSAFNAAIPSGNVLNDGYTISATDAGHVGNTTAFVRNPDGSINNDKWVNYGHRSRHLLAIAAKEMMLNYYGAYPTYSYHGGVSNGGHDGLMAAQKYPDDFDGIIAHAPAISSRTTTTAWLELMQHQFAGGPTTPTLLTTQLPLLDSLTKAKCDAMDGIVDNIIWEPQHCDFNVDADLPACPNNISDATCFTKQQRKTLQTFLTSYTYKSYGQYYGKFFPGYENDPARQFAARFIGINSNIFFFTDDAIRFLFYNNPSLNMLSLDFKTAAGEMLADVYPSGLSDSPYDVSNPNLSAFKVAGGKLLITVGGIDSLLSPMDMINYYKDLIKNMGGVKKTKDFARLFVAPGKGHSFTPTAVGSPSNFDPIPIMEQWVENGIAPDSIIGSNTDITRPICHYPLKTVLNAGVAPTDTAATKDAANFHCE